MVFRVTGETVVLANPALSVPEAAGDGRRIEDSIPTAHTNLGGTWYVNPIRGATLPKLVL